MRKNRLPTLLVLIGAMLPVVACDNPLMPRIPTQQDDGEENKNPDGGEGSASVPGLSMKPFLA